MPINKPEHQHAANVLERMRKRLDEGQHSVLSVDETRAVLAYLDGLQNLGGRMDQLVNRVERLVNPHEEQMGR